MSTSARVADRRVEGTPLGGRDRRRTRRRRAAHEASPVGASTARAAGSAAAVRSAMGSVGSGCALEHGGHGAVVPGHALGEQPEDGGLEPRHVATHDDRDRAGILPGEPRRDAPRGDPRSAPRPMRPRSGPRARRAAPARRPRGRGRARSAQRPRRPAPARGGAAADPSSTAASLSVPNRVGGRRRRARSPRRSCVAARAAGAAAAGPEAGEHLRAEHMPRVRPPEEPAPVEVLEDHEHVAAARARSRRGRPPA